MNALNVTKVEAKELGYSLGGTDALAGREADCTRHMAVRVLGQSVDTAAGHDCWVAMWDGYQLAHEQHSRKFRQGR